MTRMSFAMKTLMMILVLAAGTLGLIGCEEESTTPDVHDADVTEGDVIHDDLQQDPDVIDAPDDVTVDDVTVDEVQPEEPPPCPAACWTVPGPNPSGLEQIGGPCVVNGDCDYGATCITQSEASYGGRIYTDSYKGWCLLYGPGTTGCDPDVSTTCPDGSSCMYLFKDMGQEYYGCVDSCTPADSSNNLYEYNCGCRPGYECVITSDVCYPGCSNDFECCERWWDANGNNTREASEMNTKDGCTNTCDDGDLFTTGNEALCTVTFSCVNEGDTTNSWSGPCEGDAWCPPDGRCLDEFHYVDDNGVTYFPGGYCLKDACNFVGRGCTDFGGACANWGTDTDPFYACTKPCHFGRDLTDSTYECRTTAGQEQACMPLDTWFSAPTDGSDGVCYPGNCHPTGTGALGAPCTADADCLSPVCAGFCRQFTIPIDPYCSVFCTPAYANLCGGDDGTGKATGVCSYGACWKGCTDTTGDIATNGCDNASLACYTIAELGLTAANISLPPGTTMPTGICFGKCADDAWCDTNWVPGSTCNTTTGKCQ
jgi:hypothetical protein